MEDLREHIVTVIVILIGLIGIVGFLGRTIMKSLKSEVEKFPIWLNELGKEGGVVSRQKYFEWCKKAQEECPIGTEIKELHHWRMNIMEEGGIMTTKEHQITDYSSHEKLIKKMEASFYSQRGWVEDRLNLVKAELEKSILQAIVDLGRTIEDNGKSKDDKTGRHSI